MSASQGCRVTNAVIGSDHWTWSEGRSVGDVNGDGVPDAIVVADDGDDVV